MYTHYMHISFIQTNCHTIVHVASWPSIIGTLIVFHAIQTVLDRNASGTLDYPRVSNKCLVQFIKYCKYFNVSVHVHKL